MSCNNTPKNSNKCAEYKTTSRKKTDEIDFSDIDSVINDINLNNYEKENLGQLIDRANNLAVKENNKKVERILKELILDLGACINKHIAAGYKNKTIRVKYRYQFSVKNLTDLINKNIQKIKYFQGVDIVAEDAHNDDENDDGQPRDYSEIYYDVTW